VNVRWLIYCTVTVTHRNPTATRVKVLDELGRLRPKVGYEQIAAGYPM
jgi:hypothetical protein